jgi:hypothetical protein
MKLISFKHRYDYGHDWYVQVLYTTYWAFFQGSVSWNDYPCWPYIQIKSGSGTGLGILFWVYKFGLEISFIDHRWNWDWMEDVQDVDSGSNVA